MFQALDIVGLILYGLMPSYATNNELNDRTEKQVGSLLISFLLIHFHPLIPRLQLRVLAYLDCEIGWGTTMVVQITSLIQRMRADLPTTTSWVECISCELTLWGG
jgi:hypothetical protein